MMKTISISLLAASSYLPHAFAAPVAAPMPAPAVVDRYVYYDGAAQNFPSQNLWYSDFSSMLAANTGIMLQSCAQWGVPNNSPDEIAQLANSIQHVAGQSGVDARYILAVVMQESGGCVRAPTTNYGVRNPGVMQSHNGAGTCNDNGLIQTPCPAEIITRMIEDGTTGTSSGDGLLQLLNRSAGQGAQKYYQAARMYNSGSVDPSGNLNKGIATQCYVNDVANRLTGWAHTPVGCENGQYKAVPDSVAVPATSEAPAQPAISQVAPVPVPIPAPSSPAPQVVAPPPSIATPATIVAPQRITLATSNKMAPGVTTNCAQYYRVAEGDFCNSIAQRFGVSFADMRQLNTALDANCSNLWLGYDYCIKPASS